MKTINRALKSVLIIVLGLFPILSLSSCINDAVEDPATPGEPGINPDNEVELTIFLPEASYEKTRANYAHIEEEEGRINDLYVVIFKINYSDGSIDTSDTRFPIVENIKGQPNFNDHVTSNYQTYKRTLKEGYYKFYVLANLEENIRAKAPQDQKDKPDYYENLLKTEDGIRSLVLNFDGAVQFSKESGSLPMACLAENIRLSPSDYATGVGNDPVQVSVARHSIYAPLTILCSKVRFTVLFDHESFSNAFPENDIDVTNLRVNSLKQMTAVDPKFTLSGVTYTEIPSISFPKTKFPEEGSGYFNIDEVETPPEHLDNITSWESDNKKAWQTVIYLPENLENGQNQTVLHLAVDGEDITKDGFNVPLTLQRGCYYDIVGFLETPLTLNIFVNIRVLAWTKRNINVGW